MDDKNINFIKLTKLERKVLIVLFNSPRREEYKGSFHKLPEGCDTQSIAKGIYEDPFSRHDHLKASVRSSLSRILNNLWKKGLIFKCYPRYTKTYWHKDEWGEGDGFPGRDYEGLMAIQWREYIDVFSKQEKMERFGTFLSAAKYDQLPHNTKIWWILAEQGKAALEETQ